MKISSYLVLFSVIYLVLSSILFLKVPTFQSRFEIDTPAYTGYTEGFENNGGIKAIFTYNEATGLSWYSSCYSVGYSIFMLLVRSLFGKSYLWVILLQMLFGVLIIPLTFRISSYFFSKRVSLLASFFASISLGYILYPHFLLTETLHYFLHILAFERFVSYLFEKKSIQIALSGLIWGVSVIVKPPALYFIIFLSIFLLLWPLGNLLKNIKAVGLFLLCFFIPISGMLIRNKKVQGYYHLESLGKVGMYTHFLPLIVEKEKGISFEEAKRQVYPLIEVKVLASGKGFEKAHKLLVEKVLYHPFIIVKIWLRQMLKTLAGLHTNHLKVLLCPNITSGDCSYFELPGNYIKKAWNYLAFGTDSKFLIGLGILEVIWNVLRYILTIVGLIFLILKRRWLWGILFGGYFFYFIFTTGCHGSSRYRVMFELQLCIMAALGAFVLYDLLVSKKLKILKS